jgi:hypothetical protein
MATEEHKTVQLLRDFIGTSTNQMLFRVNVRKEDRYFGEFPYEDRETKRPKLSEVLTLTERMPRDFLAAVANDLLATRMFPDVKVIVEDDKKPVTRFKHTFEMVAFGPGIDSNLDAAVALGQFVQAMNDELHRRGYRDLPGAAPKQG